MSCWCDQVLAWKEDGNVHISTVRNSNDTGKVICHNTKKKTGRPGRLCFFVSFPGCVITVYPLHWDQIPSVTCLHLVGPPSGVRLPMWTPAEPRHLLNNRCLGLEYQANKRNVTHLLKHTIKACGWHGSNTVRVLNFVMK
jgi:hypothetical protein